MSDPVTPRRRSSLASVQVFVRPTRQDNGRIRITRVVQAVRLDELAAAAYMLAISQDSSLTSVRIGDPAGALPALAGPGLIAALTRQLTGQLP